jgi:hypothetical protein
MSDIETRVPLTEPRAEWTKDMKIQVLTKSREDMKKILKFYYSEIQDQDFSSDYPGIDENSQIVEAVTERD